MPSGVRAQKEIITKWGRIYPIDDFDNKKREKLGLPGLPTSCEAVERLLS
jgi:heterodisulfide reductase subunit C